MLDQKKQSVLDSGLRRNDGKRVRHGVLQQAAGVTNHKVVLQAGIVMPAHAGIQNSKKYPGFRVIAAVPPARKDGNNAANL